MFPFVRRRRLALALPLLGLLVAPALASAAPPPECKPLAQRGEFAGCLRVSAELSRAPAVGESATLRVKIENGLVAARDGRLVVDLPPALATAAATTRTLALEPEKTQVVALKLRAEKDGAALVRVRVAAGEHSASDGVSLTVGERSSRFGPTSDAGDRAVAAPASARLNAAPADEHEGRPPAPERTVTAAALGTGGKHCIKARWMFRLPNGTFGLGTDYGYEIWDDDGAAGDDLLASGVTDANGMVNACVSTVDGSTLGQEIYVRFKAANRHWRIRNSPEADKTYTSETAPVALIPGQDHDFDDVMPSTTAGHSAAHAYASMNRFWKWHPAGVVGCWDHVDTAANCKSITINWAPDSDYGSEQSQGQVWLAPEDADVPHVVIHEAAHALMWDIYEGKVPTPNCDGHDVRRSSSAECAWSEGFAEFVPAMVLNDKRFVWASGNEVDLEEYTHDFLWEDGDTVEGRVAAALIDLADFQNEGPWDRSSEGMSAIWLTLLHQTSSTFYEFMMIDRPAQGFDVAQDGPRLTLFHNTIDYVHEDPLSNKTPVLRPTVEMTTRYRADPTKQRWSVLGLRPTSAVDTNLSALSSNGWLTSNDPDPANVELFAVDSNQRALAPIRARVQAKAGQYALEYAESEGNILDGQYEVYVSPGSIARVWDTTLAQGVKTYFRITTSNALIKPTLYEFGAASAPQFWMQSKFLALGAGTAFAVNGPASTRRDALVLVNQKTQDDGNGAAGTVRIYRDTSGPLASVAIDQGDSTSSHDVDLTVTTTDHQTGIDGVRVSVDGTLDSEQFVPLPADGKLPVTLPVGTGTRKVIVQSRNRAWMKSNEAVDTITVTP